MDIQLYFIDELEAYFGMKIYLSELHLMRLDFHDKIEWAVFNIPTKQKNFFNKNRDIKMPLTFIVTKELNKVMGFEVPLVWDYTNTNSFAHPIMKILIKRIELSEKIYGAVPSEKEIIAKWFPEKIRGIEPANYILNNSWCKPRDIVRFILAAKSCLCSTNSSFSQATCEMCHKKYSLDSLTEIKEEMRALYSPEQIDCINTCLNGFRAVFSIRELEERISKHFKDSILSDDLNSVLQDLYRLGIIGNYLKIQNYIDGNTEEMTV